MTLGFVFFSHAMFEHAQLQGLSSTQKMIWVESVSMCCAHPSGWRISKSALLKRACRDGKDLMAPPMAKKVVDGLVERRVFIDTNDGFYRVSPLGCVRGKGAAKNHRIARRPH